MPGCPGDVSRPGCAMTGDHLKSVSSKKKMLPGKQTTGILLILVVVISLSFLSGCVGTEETVDINMSRTQEGVVWVTPEDTDVVYFGFDQRLSPKEDARIYAPFLQYLSNETGRTFKIRFTPDYAETQDELGKGITHFAALGGLSYIQAHEKYGVISIARGLNVEGRGDYRAAIVTRPDSDIATLEDIRGRSFCFGSTHSTQGHLMPRQMLEHVNITLTDLGGYRYTSSHQDCAHGVMRGDCDAGGLQDTLAITLANKGVIRIVGFSDYYPSSGICANKDVDPLLLEAVKKALLDFDPKGKHAELLTDWNRTEMPSGFIDASEADYTGLTEIAKKYNIT